MSIFKNREYILAVIIEKIHRYLYDNVHVQRHDTTFKEWCINKVYDILAFKLLPNWRYILHEYVKTLNVNRYSKYNKEIN